MSDYPLPDYQSTDAPSQIAQSLQQSGFAVLRHSPIDPTLVERTYQDWWAFFASNQKVDYTFDPKLQAGYFPLGTEQAKGHTTPDLKEFFHIYQGHPLPPEITAATWELFDQLRQLATELLTWVEAQAPPRVQAGFSEPLSAMIAHSSETLFRILHYPPLPPEIPSGAIRAAAHEDINLITLLPAATEMGLELLDPHGQWRSVVCDRGDIVVNAGDMLQWASQGFYRSATHRVINPDGPARHQSRLSMPLFLHPRPEVVLAEGKTARQYLQERLRELGLL